MLFRSPQMCDRYSERYSNITVIHKENGGLSSARNAGVKIVNGDYIAFIDSDDFIEPEMYAHMVDVIQRQKTDMVICGLQYIDEQGRGLNTERTLLAEQTDSDSIALKILDGWWEFVPVWNKLYKAETIKSYLFPEGKIHEDEFTVHHYLGKCKEISIISEKYYKYVFREGSIAHSDISIKSFDALDAYYDRYEYYKKVGKIELAEKTFEKMEDIFCDRRYKIKVFGENFTKLKEIDRRFNNHYVQNCSHGRLWKIVFKISPKTYSILLKINMQITVRDGMIKK